MTHVAARPPSRMLRQGLHTVAVRSVTLACRMVLLVVIGKSLPPSEYGVYALISTIGIFGTVTLGLNLYNYVYRAVPGASAQEQMRVFKSTSAFEVATASVVVSTLLLSGALPHLASLVNAAGYELFLGLGLAQIVLLVAIAETTHFFAAQARLEESNWVDFLAQGAWVLVPAALWLAGFPVGLGTFIGAQFAGLGAAILYAAVRIGPGTWFRQPVERRVIRTGLAFSLPMMVPALSLYSLKLADRPILSHYVSLADVGVYAFAFALLNTLYSFTAGVVFATVGPRIVAAHNAGDLGARDALQSYMLKVALLAFAVPSVALFALSRPLLGLVARPEYLASAAVMPLVALSFLLIILATPAHTLLTMQNRVKTLAAVDVIGMAVGLAGTLLLIPHFSYWGAAAASAAGFFTTMVLKYTVSGILSVFRFDVLFSVRDDVLHVSRHARRIWSGRTAGAAQEAERPVPADTFDV